MGFFKKSGKPESLPLFIPPAELNKMIETELQRIAKQKEADALEPVN